MPGSAPVGRVCRQGLERGRTRNPVVRVRSSDIATLWLRLDLPDTDPSVHGELIRLSAGYLDQGQAHATLPGRHQGFLRAVTELYARGASAPVDCRGAETAMRRAFTEQMPARDVILEALHDLGVEGDDIQPYLFATALALPGWTGMFARLERHPEDHPGGPPSSLAEFLAVRLLLERAAVSRACRRAGVEVRWTGLRGLGPAVPGRSPVLDASLLWGLATKAGWLPDRVASLDDAALSNLWAECADFSDVHRRQLFQDAYERTYRHTILDALAARRALPVETSTERPRAQFVFCIDEREESIRRAIEEQHPGHLTYGAAGFFGVAIDYQGLYDLEPAAHCPVVVTPAHEVHEQPVYTELGWHAPSSPPARSLARLGTTSSGRLTNAEWWRQHVVPVGSLLGRQDPVPGDGSPHLAARGRSTDVSSRTAADHPAVDNPRRRRRANRAQPQAGGLCAERVD